MKKGFALAAIAVLVMAFGTVAFVPSVRAQVGELLRWFRFESPAGGGEVSFLGSAEFTPLRPSYLPAGFQSMAVGLSAEGASLNYWNSISNRIVIIDQERSSGDRSLPPGINVTVNGQPAVLVTGLEGAISFVALRPTPPVPLTPPAESDQVEPVEPITMPDETVSYTDGKQLTWYVGDIKVKMLSNLSVEEMVKIAASLVPAEAGEGE